MAGSGISELSLSGGNVVRNVSKGFWGGVELSVPARCGFSPSDCGATGDVACIAREGDVITAWFKGFSDADKWVVV